MALSGKIVVIDDDTDFLEYIRIVLESHGYHVRTAASTETGLTLMREDKPDLVLLDVMVSFVLDGLHVMRHFRDDPQLKDVPVIMVSAIVSRDEAGLLPTNERMPVDAFMTKPIDPSDLLEQVARLIQPHKSVPSSPST
jgi:CheY-like chemotaxis protein